MLLLTVGPTWTNGPRWTRPAPSGGTQQRHGEQAQAVGEGELHLCAEVQLRRHDRGRLLAGGGQQQGGDTDQRGRHHQTVVLAHLRHRVHAWRERNGARITGMLYVLAVQPPI